MTDTITRCCTVAYKEATCIGNRVRLLTLFIKNYRIWAISTFGEKMVRPVVKCKIGETGQTLQTEKNICGIVIS